MPLLQRLSLSRKFLILGLIAVLMAAVPTFLHVVKALEDIRAAKAEARGMPVLMALQKVVQYSQQHRGLSSGMLSGNASMEQRRPGVRDNVSKALAAVDEQMGQADVSPELKASWDKIKQRWQALEPAVASKQLQAADSTRQHTQLIAAVLRVNAETLSEFGLILDSSADTSNLINASFDSAPWLTEKLGVMRAMGSGFLTQNNLPPQGKGTLMSLKDRAVELHDEVQLHMSEAMKASPHFREVLSKPVDDLKVQVDKTLGMADQQLINAAEFNFPATQYFDEFTRTIDAVYQLNGLAQDTLKQALNDRVSELYRGVFWVLALQVAGTVAAIALALVFVRSITQPIQQAVHLASEVAQGNLTVEYKVHGTNEISQLLQALASMQSSLRHLVSTVRKEAESVASASSQIAQGNNDLAARTEQEASALEQTAAAMEQLNVHVRTNADHAREADTLTHQAREVALQGGQVVSEVVGNMREIHASSSKIADIIGVIDGIAFQTNILALNAAVEAARAGEQGRGFAVVASEVRSLAGRSAEAAKEIKALISDSVDRIATGATLVDQAGQTTDEVVKAINRVTELMADISAASSAQSLSVNEVGQAVTQLDLATQQNAALVEESAAAAESLHQQAGGLVSSVSAFKI